MRPRACVDVRRHAECERGFRLIEKRVVDFLLVLIELLLGVTTTGVFTIGPLGPCPPFGPSTENVEKLKISHTAVIAARVAKQRRHRDSV